MSRLVGEPPGRAGHSVPWSAVLLLVSVGVSALLGVVAIFVLSLITDRPSFILAGGLLVFLALAWLLIRIVVRKAGPGRRGLRNLAVGLVLVAVSYFSLSTLIPVGDAQLGPAPVNGQKYWHLETGSRIAYVEVSAKGRDGGIPLVFLHGGPGVPDMKHDSAYFGQLARNGFDVYTYDELGSGLSSRLQDPDGYGIRRDEADLEAIRKKIGARNMALIGYSYGAKLAAIYMADHPHRVSRAVFISPEGLAPDERTGNTTRRLDFSQKLSVYSLMIRTRVLLAFGLLQTNPEAAHKLVGDDEMDARFDRIYNRSRPALACDGHELPPVLHGLGMYANSYPQSAGAPQDPDPRPALTRLKTPALIVKGSCDYLPWQAATEYRKVLSNGQLAYIRGAGHANYEEKPTLILAEIRAFLLDRRPPVGYRASVDEPSGYGS